MAAKTEPERVLVIAHVSYNLDGASDACGLSVSEIQKAIREGDLIANYRGRKPLIRAVELDAWIASLPTYPPRRGL